MAGMAAVENIVRSHPEVRIYIHIADGEVLAMLLPKDVDVERIAMLLDTAREEDQGAYSDYFSSKWFPLAQSDSMEHALELLNHKVNAVSPDRSDDYVMTVTSHWGNIEDNFKAHLFDDFDEATSYEKQLKAAIKARAEG